MDDKKLHFYLFIMNVQILVLRVGHGAGIKVKFIVLKVNNKLLIPNRELFMEDKDVL